MTDLRASLFCHALDAHPKPWTGSWQALQGLLDRPWCPSEELGVTDLKKALPAISAATYAPGSRRGRAGVLALGILFADIDNAEERPTGQFHLDRVGCPTNRPVMEKICIASPVHPEAVLGELQRQNLAAYLYTTWSHTDAWPRFRLVMPLAEPVAPGCWGAATEWLWERAGLRCFYTGLDIPVLRDTARMHFLPAGASAQRWRSQGGILTVPIGDLKRFERKAPQLAMWQRRILVQQAMKGRWDRGLSMDLRSLDLAGLMQSRGCAVGAARPYGAATKWRTHCPWAGEHSHGVDDDSGVIIHQPGRWPIWRCAHSHHAHLGLRDILEVCGVLA